MFGIGLPEMIVIFAVALIVVGPDKLPEMAKSLARGIMEMKKAANQLKENLTEEEGAISEVKKDLEETAAELKKKMLEAENRVTERQLLEEKKSEESGELIEISPENPRPWEIDAQKTPEQEDKENTGTHEEDSAEDPTPSDQQQKP